MQIYITWIHIVSFSTWLGANLFCLAVFLPASASLPADTRRQARSRAGRGLNRIVAISAPLVLISGLAPLLSPALVGWNGLSLMGIKLVLTLGMMVNHWLQAFRYAPGAVRKPHGYAPTSDQEEGAWKTWVRLLAVNVALGLIVLVLGLSLVA